MISSLKNTVCAGRKLLPGGKATRISWRFSAILDWDVCFKSSFTYLSYDLWHHFVAAPSSVTSVITEERREGIALFRMRNYGDVSHLYAKGESRPLPHGSVRPLMIRPSVMTEREAADMSESEEKLFGVTPEMEKGFQKLKEIFDKEVFELYIRQGQGYVPYMMNDALECYLVLTDCRCTGEYLTGYEESTLGYLSSAEGERILVVHQGEENIFTLWFREIRIKLEGYQYHRIGILAGGERDRNSAAAGLYAGNGLRQV